LVRHSANWGDAGTSSLTIDMHGTGTALGNATAKFRSG
jgi:hypothetical protein